MLDMTRGWAHAESTITDKPRRKKRSTDPNADAQEDALPDLEDVTDPRHADELSRIDWEAIETEYVWGDTLGQREDGTFLRKYPTFKQLAKKYGLATATVHYHAKRGKWADRRLAVIAKTKAAFDEELAKARGRESANVVDTLDRWIKKFDANLTADKIPADTVSDLNTVVRLRSFVLGGGDSRTEARVLVTLDMLHDRHAKQRGRIIEAHGEVAGELPESDAMTGTVD